MVWVGVFGWLRVLFACLRAACLLVLFACLFVGWAGGWAGGWVGWVGRVALG